MTNNARRYEVNLAAAMRVLTDHMNSLGGRSYTNRCLNDHVIQRFLTDLCEPRMQMDEHFILSEHGLIQWMIRDLGGRTARDACARCAALRRYLHLLTDVQLLEADILANLRSHYGVRSWRAFAKAIQSQGNKALLPAMQTKPLSTLGYRIDRTVAEGVLARLLTSIFGQSRTNINLHRRVVQKLIRDFCMPREKPEQRLVLDEPRLLQWMIHDSIGRNVVNARSRLAVVARYLRALAQADLVDTDLMAEFRACHGNGTWDCLVPAFHSDDPEASLAAIRTVPPPPGPLALSVRAYVALHQSLGRQYERPRRILQHIDRFLQTAGVRSIQAITSTLIEQWAEGITSGRATRRVTIRVVHRFFSYLNDLKIVMHNPVSALLGKEGRLPRSAFKPFIFTSDQVAAILAEARQLSSTSYCPLKSETCYTMIALLYALGLRHGEARRLRIGDLDLDRGLLFINQTKFYKNRYVPFGPKVAECLRRFFNVRRTVLKPLHPDDPLFVTLWRAPVDHHFLLRAFRGILDFLNIRGPERHQAPRLHDLRHTFAVHRLLRWYREEQDVASRLPLLTTFMGHVDTRSTEVYLTITQELLQEANSRFYQQFGRLLGKEVLS